MYSHTVKKPHSQNSNPTRHFFQYAGCGKWNCCRPKNDTNYLEWIRINLSLKNRIIFCANKVLQNNILKFTIELLIRGFYRTLRALKKRVFSFISYQTWFEVLQQNLSSQFELHMFGSWGLKVSTSYSINQRNAIKR